MASPVRTRPDQGRCRNRFKRSVHRAGNGIACRTHGGGDDHRRDTTRVVRAGCSHRHNHSGVPPSSSNERSNGSSNRQPAIDSPRIIQCDAQCDCSNPSVLARRASGHRALATTNRARLVANGSRYLPTSMDRCSAHHRPRRLSGRRCSRRSRRARQPRPPCSARRRLIRRRPTNTATSAATTTAATPAPSANSCRRFGETMVHHGASVLST